MFLTQTIPRQKEILEVVLRNGWDYMRSLLTGDKTSTPQLPTPAVLRNILVDLGPVYIKLGQLLSTRPDLLPARYIQELSALQSDVPAVAWPAIETVIRRELKLPLEEVFTQVNHDPVAAGSIAQTHQAILKDGRLVAIKVQRPGIEIVINQDIALIKGLAELVSFSEFGQDLDIISIAQDFIKALQAELNFTKEAGYAIELKRNLSQSRWFDPTQLVIPEIYRDLTTEKLLVMEWLDGKPLLESEISATQTNDTELIAKRQAITTLLFRVFLQQCFIDGMFHADPHPGNIFYLSDGRLALLDCGLIGRIDPKSQEILTELLLAIVNIDAKRCAQLTVQLGDSDKPINLAKLEIDYNRMLRKYYNLSLTEINFGEVFYEVLELARKNKLRLPSNMGLYAKTIANLEGVARIFNPEVNLLDQIKPLITDLFQRQLLGDNPWQALLRTALDFKGLSLQSPRQIELLLDRVTSETLKWNLTLKDLDALQHSIDRSANRLSLSIVIGSLIIGAAIISSSVNLPQMSIFSNILFGCGGVLGLWLIISIIRSNQLK